MIRRKQVKVIEYSNSHYVPYQAKVCSLPLNNTEINNYTRTAPGEIGQGNENDKGTIAECPVSKETGGKLQKSQKSMPEVCGKGERLRQDKELHNFWATNDSVWERRCIQGVFVCGYTCAYVHMSAHVSIMHIGTHTCGRQCVPVHAQIEKRLVTLVCQFLGAVHFVFLRQSYSLAKNSLIKLAGQQVSSIHLPALGP